jgi:hypothetical protein
VIPGSYTHRLGSSYGTPNTSMLGVGLFFQDENRNNRAGMDRLKHGRVWKPFQGSNNRAVAPMVEQRSPKPRVVGSSPACPAHLSREV